MFIVRVRKREIGFSSRDFVVRERIVGLNIWSYILFLPHNIHSNIFKEILQVNHRIGNDHLN